MESYTDNNFHGEAIGKWTLTGKEHARNWREMTGQQTWWKRLEQLMHHADAFADRHPRISLGTGGVILLLWAVLIPPLISASNEADRVLGELEASRILRGAIVVPAPDPQVDGTPVPKFEPKQFEPQPPSPIHPLTKAYLELSIPTREGKSMAEIMVDLGYRFYQPPHLPEVPDQLRAGDMGNYFRRLPLNWQERQFFDRFQTLNILGSVNAGDPFPSFTILPIDDPKLGIVEFYSVTPKGWVNIAQVNVNNVNWFIQDPGPEIRKLIEGYKIPNRFQSEIA